MDRSMKRSPSDGVNTERVPDVLLLVRRPLVGTTRYRLIQRRFDQQHKLDVGGVSMRSAPQNGRHAPTFR